MKVIFNTFLLLLIPFTFFAQSKIEIGVTSGIGHDFQTRSNDFNLTGPLFIPASGTSSILHIEKPYFVNLDLTYQFNKTLGLVLNLGTTNRALKYWSLDSENLPTTFSNDKIDLGIRTYNIEPGLKFQGDISDKLNFYWIQSFGIGFGHSSPRSTLTKEHKQAELIFLQNQQSGVLVNVNQDDLIISINSAFGVGYQLFNRVRLNIGLRFINEVSNGNRLIIWGYDIESDEKSGGYTPYDMEFKTIYTTIGLSYQLGKS